MKQNFEVLSRCIAAIVGGYVFSSVLSIALVPLLVQGFHHTLSDSVLIAAMCSYVSYFALIILSFYRFNHWKIWLGLLLSSSLLWLLAQLVPTS